MVMDAVRGYLQLAGGVTEMSRQRATAMAKAMLTSPETTREQVSALAADLLELSRTNRDAVGMMVRNEVDRGLARMGLATSEEVAELTGRVRSLESAVSELRAALRERADEMANRVADKAAASSTAAEPATPQEEL